MTSTSLEFTSSVRRSDPITFTIDGTEYGFIPPKSAVMMLPAYVAQPDRTFLRAQFDWFEQGLNLYDWTRTDPADRRTAYGLDQVSIGDGVPAPTSPDLDLPPEDWQGPQSAGLEARLRDRRDKLDTDTIDDVITRLAEAVSGRPTT